MLRSLDNCKLDSCRVDDCKLDIPSAMKQEPAQQQKKFHGVGIKLTHIIKTGGNNRVRIGSIEPQGPAAKAGLQINDIIIEVDGTNFNNNDTKKSPDDVAKVIRDSSGTTIRVIVEREGKKIAFTMKRMPNLGVGIKLAPMPNTKNQVCIEFMDAKGPAAKIGLQIGDVIIEVDGKKVPNEDKTSSDDVASMIRGPLGTTLSMMVERNGKKMHYSVERGPIDGVAVVTGNNNKGTNSTNTERKQKKTIQYKAQSREEEILRELGIMHLDNKVTRARNNYNETDALILKQAGVVYVSTDEYKENLAAKKSNMKKKDKAQNVEVGEEVLASMKPLSLTEAKILRKAGVTWLDDMAVVYDDTSITAASGSESMVEGGGLGSGGGESTVNSTYAERELLHRLKSGCTSTGKVCECGMPIIKDKGGLLECVTCGVVGEDEEHPIEGVYEYEPFPSYTVAEPGVVDVGSTTNMSLSQSLEGENIEYDTVNEHCHGCQTVLVNNAVMMDDDYLYCEDCAFGHTDKENLYANDAIAALGTEELEGITITEEDRLEEAIGEKLFEGWELTNMNCMNESCNLPLLRECAGVPSICLRCG